MDRDARLLISIPRNELPRLQRAWHISATLRHPASSDVLYDYMRAVEVAIRPPIPYGAEDCYNFRDLILATYIASLLVSSRQDLLPDNVKNALHIAQPADSERRRSNKNLNLLRFAHATPTLSDQFLAANGVMFPLVLLSPDQATLLSSAIFSAFEGLLPALLMRTESSSAPVPERIISAMNYSTAATLLHVAKRVQDLPAGTNIPFPGFAEGLTVGPSLLLLFYSLSLSLSPSAAIYNNLGLVLAGIAPAITHEGGGHYHMSEELELAQAGVMGIGLANLSTADNSRVEILREGFNNRERSSASIDEFRKYIEGPRSRHRCN
jgi:protein O-GlcNAc transferase